MMTRPVHGRTPRWTCILYTGMMLAPRNPVNYAVMCLIGDAGFSQTLFSCSERLWRCTLTLIAGLPGLTATTFCITGGFFVAATATGCAMVCILLFRLATLLSLGYTFITSVLISHGDVGHSADTRLLTFHIGIPLSPRWSYHWTAAHPHLGNSKSEILHTERS